METKNSRYPDIERGNFDIPKVKQAVILAGGRGTRLSPITDTTPKPMILFDNKPFLEYLVEMLKDNGVTEIVLLLGYLSEKVEEYFGDGSSFGIKIKYSIGPVSDMTGTRIRKAKKLLDEQFLLMYCDNYLPLNLEKLVAFHQKQKKLASVMVYSNKDGITINNMFVDDKGIVVTYDKTRTDPKLNGVEIGFFILNKKVIFEMMPKDNFSFEKVIIPPLIADHQLAGCFTDHRYYSVGSHERLELTERFLREKKAIFLDRDGVINKKAPKADYVKNWKEFEFLPGALEGISLLTRQGYQIIIISNQAGIARGAMTEADLRTIHRHMVLEISKQGGRIVDIYFCPHAWDGGCECRKPKPGMFYQAQRDHHLDLSKTMFIGDDVRDKTAGDAAGVQTYLVNEQNNLVDVVSSLMKHEPPSCSVSYDMLFDDVLARYHQCEEDRFVISIAGCSRCGKTKLAEKIRDDLIKQGIATSIISLDNWLLGVDERTGGETVRERFQYDQIAQSVMQLKQGRKIYPPVYDAQTRMIISKKQEEPIFLEKRSVGIIDGIVALDIDQVRECSDYKIYVDADDEKRHQRLIEFYAKYKNYTVSESKKIIQPRERDEVDIIKKTQMFADVTYRS